MAELIERRLSAAGLQRYEISNYARPGFHSRHNVNYWQSGDYLGIGAGDIAIRALQTVAFTGAVGGTRRIRLAI